MSKLATELAALEVMSPAELQKEWSRVYRAAAPSLAPDLLRRGIAYQLQAKRFGDLSASTLRVLRRAADNGSADTRTPVLRRKLTAGTRLVRQWHGETHTVIGTEEGFLFDDRHYASLTAIARRITGAKWSGPRFFGLIS